LGITTPLTLRQPLGRSHLLASTIVREARRLNLPFDSLAPVGSLRRYSPDIGDVALLAVVGPDRRSQLPDSFATLPSVTGVVGRNETHVVLSTDRGHVTVWFALPSDSGAALVWHTGSRAHTASLQRRAQSLSLRFTGGALTYEGGGPIAVTSETELYRRLDLPYIAPELREGLDEIETAERHELPALVAGSDIKGDLHMHSTWSDGRDSVEHMVRAAGDLGYQYIAITDHSQNAWCSRTLAEADIRRQRDEIEALRLRFPAIEILHGVEVDIMKDGSLDFDDEDLEGFDIVLASLHDHGGQPGTALTERYLQAIHHPLVNVVTHPANRSPGHSAGYDIDFDRLFDAAVETGTAMEIDGAPGHLDMDGAIARRAAAAGVTLTIDSDCHRAEALGRQMRFGIGTARRGWVEPRHVLNTRGVDAVRDFVAAKRARR